MKISICTDSTSNAGSSGLDYAVREITHFLEEFTTADVTEGENGADAAIRLYIDKGMEPHCYSLKGDGSVLRICGGNASSVLCGIYEGLADAGILFEACGYSLPDRFDLEAFLHSKKEVSPKCRLRGIRQHINFPMDISSYSLKEAKEYIRGIARMRFNAITFHSYAGQWHSVRPGDPDSHGGHFFYGQQHPVTTADPLTASRINNRRIYCIPEAEAMLENPDALDEYARYWLNQVMDTAKEACMTITLSVELPFDEDDSNCSMLHEVCRTYPRIDVIELISYESGSGGSIQGLTNENAADVLSGLFGKEILDKEGKLQGLGSRLPKQLGGAAVSLSRILMAVSAREKWLKGLEKTPELRAGLYITCEETLGILCPIMRRLLPQGMSRSLLPAHGALNAAAMIEKICTDEKDWQDTMFYTWAEFDGNMYLQQLSADGIEKLVFLQDSKSIYGFCINHWRTSENRITIAYAAEAAVRPVSADVFYRDYADKIGIKASGSFARACRRLAGLDTFCRENLFNIGFCFVRCWFSKNSVVRPRGYSREAQNHAIEAYEAAAGKFKIVLASADSREAVQLLRLMINRCKASVLHIKAMLVLEDIHQYYDYDRPGKLTQEQKEAIADIIARSRRYAQDYIHLYGEMLPDRGCEGLIVSYYETTPVFIEAVAGNFTDNRGLLQTDTFDAPPSPDDESRQDC